MVLGIRTVESEVESESFLPASLVIHSSLGSVEGALLLMPGTTRGMVGWIGRWGVWTGSCDGGVVVVIVVVTLMEKVFYEIRSGSMVR
jgi:hypothetical protein